MATAGAFTDVAELAIANLYFKNITPTPPSSLFLAAFTVVPTDASGGTEVTAANGYARVALTCGTAGTGAGSAWTVTAPGTTITNTADILYAVASGSWGTVVGFALFDASSGGSMIARFDQTVASAAISVAIATNDQLKVPAGSLSLVVD